MSTARDENAHQAFSITSRVDPLDAFVYVYNPEAEVVLTYRVRLPNWKERHLVGTVVKPFPFGCLSAYDYFKHMWAKVLLNPDSPFSWDCWRDHKTFDPMEKI